MPTVEVNCTVSNCVFHKKGNVCGANQIQVDMDYHPKNNNTEFASDFDLQIDSNSNEANHSSDTCCKTFVSKANHRN